MTYFSGEIFFLKITYKTIKEMKHLKISHVWQIDTTLHCSALLL